MHLQLKLKRSDHSLRSNTMDFCCLCTSRDFACYDIDVVTTCFRELQAQEDGKQAYNGD